MHKDSCKLYKVEKDEKVGRCLVATNDIAVNEIILTEVPIVVGPHYAKNSEPVCLGCLKPVNLKAHYNKCPRCLWPTCSTNCSHLLEGFHAIECTILSYGKIHISENSDFRYEAIVPLRCLILQKSSPRRWKLISQMEHHLNERKLDSDICRNVNELYKYLRDNFLDKLPSDMLQDTSSEMIQKICGIVDVNSVDINTGKVDLSALYEMFSMIEHSCIPNVKVVFNGHKILVRAGNNISKDDHISTMYTNCTWGTRMRQDHLWHTKYFRCKCKRCADPTEFGTNFSTLKCTKTSSDSKGVTCRGDILSVNPLIENSDWRCNRCDVIMVVDEVDSMVCRLGYNADQITQKDPKVEQLEDLLKKLLKFLHPNHFHCFSVKHSLIQAYGHQQDYQHNQLTDQLLNRKIDICRQLVAIMSKLDSSSSRMPLYISVVHYELSSAILEKARRNSSNVKLMDDCKIESRYFLTQAMSILNDEKNPSSGFKLAVCCKKLIDKI